MLVLGAGACGLPLELHKRLKSVETLAVDLNPVLLLTAKKLLSDQQLNLCEFPKIPVDSDDVAVSHQISGERMPDNFHMLFADGQGQCFQKEAFTTVVTPWFIDIISRDFRDFARHLNQAIGKGGHWINIGQLDFQRYDLTQIYTKNEIREILEEAGFKVEHLQHVQLPYLQSPHSMVGRSDQILVFSAVKERTSKIPPQYDFLPEWLRDWQKPVPKSFEIETFQMKTNIYAQTINFVDGSRSLNDIADILSSQFGMNKEYAQEAVFNFFVNVYEQLIFREF